uniref:C2H2-type domain-containing protein n=1 Tax=Oncorhynchus tshawytscha TaxID=74940 RepID=A0AAZ3PGL2_ONCTS
MKQEDPEPTHIKEEQQEHRLSQEDPPQPSHHYQNQTVDDGEMSALPIIITEEIKTDPDGEDYRVPQPTSDQPLSVHPDCSAAVERPYQCKQCGNSFTRKGHLTIHSRTHTGENPYQCKQCGKRFNQKSNLTIHTRVHTGENPYQCKQCGKMFNQKGHLTVHSRIHTGERPYQCKDCDKAFNQKIELTLHMRAHTGERPYICPVCKKGYIALSYLRLHQRVHTGEKPYHLKSHMSTHTKTSSGWPSASVALKCGRSVNTFLVGSPYSIYRKMFICLIFPVFVLLNFLVCFLSFKFGVGFSCVGLFLGKFSGCSWWLPFTFQLL